MNEMYTMTIVIHLWGTFAFLAVLAFNMAQLYTAADIRSYAKRMRIFMPISASLIALLLFTGAIMMAAKHLSFTIENIVMIVFGVLLIVLEFKRYLSLKHADLSQENILATYKTKAMKILTFELVWSVAITVWMMV